MKNKEKKEKKVKTQKKDPIIKNPKVRKRLIWGGTLLTIAGITIGITVPLVLEEQNKANINAFSKEDILDGMSLKDFEKNIKELGVKDRSILDKSLFAIKEKLYEKQVNAQEEYIKYFYDNYENKKLYPGFSDSDVPTKMKTLDEVREDRRKFLQQEEATFKDNFGSEGSANGAWGTHRAQTYGGATNNDEAVDYLVDKEIKTQAFEGFKYSYRSMNKWIFDEMYTEAEQGDFILKDNYAKLIKDNQIKDGSGTGTGTGNDDVYHNDEPIPGDPEQHLGDFKADKDNKMIYVLAKKEDWTEGDGDKNNKDNYEWAPYKELKVWFLASGLKNKMAVKKADLTNLVNGEGNKDTLYQVRNMVLGIKYDEKDGRNPLDVDNQFLINMLQRHKNLAFSDLQQGKNHGFDILDEVMDKIDDTNNKPDSKKASTFISHYTPKPDDTAQKGGSLGIMTFSNAMEQFVPGFWAGIAYALKNQATLPSISFATLFNKFIADNAGNNTPPHIQTLIGAINTQDRDQHSQIQRAVEALTPSEKNAVFSDIWHSFSSGATLDLSKGFPFVAKIGSSNNVFLVYSKQFGFHLVKFASKDQSSLEQDLGDGLSLMAKGKDSEIEVDISKLITKRFNNPTILKTILDNEGDAYKDEKAELMNQRKKINDDKEITEEDFTNKLYDLINPLLTNKNLNSLIDKFTYEVYKQFLDMKDAHIFAGIEIQDIYDAVKEEAGVK